MTLLDNPSQIVLRQKHLLLNDILLLCPRTDQLSLEIKKQIPAAGIKVLAWDYAGFICHQQDAEVQFSIQLPVNWQPTHIVLFMPKSKDVLPLMFAALSRLLNSAKKIWLVGEKQEGIESAARKLAGKTGYRTSNDSSELTEKCDDKKTWQTTKLDAARHCQLWEIAPNSELPGQLEDHWQLMKLTVPFVGDIHFNYLPGVFSSGRLDPGTELLLANLPKLRRLRSEIPVRILDFGCGCGVVGFCLHLLYPEFQIEMVDVSLLALESAKRSAKANSFKVKIFPSCGLTEVEKGLSAIVTNPPFHQGVKQDTRTTQQFLQNCSAFLLKGGSLILVANRFLPYADWIDRYVGKSTVLAENSKFRVYHAVKI